MNFERYIMSSAASNNATCCWLVAIVTDVCANVILYLIFVLSVSIIVHIAVISTPTNHLSTYLLPVMAIEFYRFFLPPILLTFQLPTARTFELMPVRRTAIAIPLLDSVEKNPSIFKVNETWQNLKINIMHSMIPLYTSVHVKSYDSIQLASRNARDFPCVRFAFKRCKIAVLLDAPRAKTPLPSLIHKSIGSLCVHLVESFDNAKWPFVCLQRKTMASNKTEIWICLVRQCATSHVTLIFGTCPSMRIEIGRWMTDTVCYSNKVAASLRFASISATVVMMTWWVRKNFFDPTIFSCNRPDGILSPDNNIFPSTPRYLSPM